jgi:hypothetical protein
MPRLIAAWLLDALPIFLALVPGTLGFACLLRRLLPRTPRSLVLVSGFGLHVLWLVTVGHLLGLVGVLGFATSVMLLLLPSAGMAAGHRWVSAIGPIRWQPFHALWLLPLVSGVVTMVAASMPPGSLWGGEPNAYDVLSYHLQIPREWHDVGRIVPLEHNVFSRMPLGNEVLFLIAMHLKGGAAGATLSAHFVNVALGLGTTLAGYAAVRGIGGSKPAGIVAAMLIAGTPWVMMLSSIAYNEPLYLLATALTVAWLLRVIAKPEAAGPAKPTSESQAPQSGSASREADGIWTLVLCGLFVGLGTTAKYPAVAMILVPVVLIVGMTQRSVMKPLLVAGVAAAVAGPWLVRNAIWHANPVSPLVFGVGEWEQVRLDRFAEAHSSPPDESGSDPIFGEVLLDGRFGYGLVPLSLLAATLLGHVKHRAAWIAGPWVGVMLGVWWFATHEIGRFLVPVIPIFAITTGVAATRHPWIVWLAPLVAGFGLVQTLFLHDPDLPDIDSGLIGLLGDDRLQVLGLHGLPIYLSPFDEDPGVAVYLVGDAKAYAYPAADLHYKVVFDVPPADDALTAWLGDALEDAPDDALVVTSRSELDRLHRTYGTPLLTVDLPPVATMRQVRNALSDAADQ